MFPNQMGGNFFPGGFPGGSIAPPSIFPGPPGNQGSDGPPRKDMRGPGVFHKTRMCNDWMEGNCRYGTNCRYAHGQEELRSAPVEAYEQLERDKARKENDVGPQRGGGKLRLCDRFMQTGTCSYGDRCIFAHGYDDPRPKGESGRDMRDGPGGSGPGGPGTGAQGGMFDGGVPGMMSGMMSGMQGMSGPFDPFRSGGGMMSKGPAPPSGPPPQGPPPSSNQSGQSLPGPPSAGPSAGQGNQGQAHRGQSKQRPVTPPPNSDPPATSQPAASSTAAAQAAAPPPAKIEVTFVDRVRATCGILNIGAAASINKERPAAIQAAISALKSGAAFRENPFADDVEQYLPGSSAAAAVTS